MSCRRRRPVTCPARPAASRASWPTRHRGPRTRSACCIKRRAASSWSTSPTTRTHRRAGQPDVATEHPAGPHRRPRRPTVRRQVRLAARQRRHRHCATIASSRSATIAPTCIPGSVVDAGADVVMPGLIEMHAHLSPGLRRKARPHLAGLRHHVGAQPRVGWLRSARR